tara:strand:- start:1466 stop:2164 length:699 start_codon:yes stop_codon:yes gene_type:complete
MKISFIVPCLNEQDNILDTVKEIFNVLKSKLFSDYEIIIVDDGSTDKTSFLVKKLYKNKKIILIKHKKNIGFGGAYKSGLKVSSGDYVIMVPGDNAHSSDEILKILELSGKADIIIPYTNSLGERNLPRFLLSKTFTFLINILFFLNVKYYNGLVLHKGNLIRNIEIDTNGFTYQVYALVTLLKKGATYFSVNVIVKERQSGKSSALKIKNIIEVFVSIVRLRLKLFKTNLK